MGGRARGATEAADREGRLHGRQKKVTVWWMARDGRAQNVQITPRAQRPSGAWHLSWTLLPRITRPAPTHLTHATTGLVMRPALSASTRLYSSWPAEGESRGRDPGVGSGWGGVGI